MEQQPGSTTLVVIGTEATTAITALAPLANVETASFAEQTDTTDAEIVRWSATSRAPYVVHDRDPLAHVAAAWVEFFDDRSTHEVLQIEIQLAVTAAERGEIQVPDYYVVFHPEDLPPTWKHWWLGVVAAASPNRVIPWSQNEASLDRLLRRLPTGRAWPEVTGWLPRLTTAVPDRHGLLDAA